MKPVNEARATFDEAAKADSSPNESSKDEEA
jgi:hypothetical protein